MLGVTERQLQNLERDGVFRPVRLGACVRYQRRDTEETIRGGADFLLWQRNQAVGNLADWKANFGMGSAISAAAAVPEPSAADLVMAAVATLGGVQRRRRLQTTCA